MFFSLKHNHRSLLIAITVAVVVVFGVVFFPLGASATNYITNTILGGFLYAVSWLVYGMVMLGGQILTLLLVVLIWVASYNNFINEPIVEVGWVLVRDLANMVFIVALLYMAFNMVFGMRGKGGSLLTLIINAGLINFSKMIAGLFIDVSQVVMLTFVHGFYDIAAGNLLEAFGLQDILSFNPITNDVLSGGSTEAGTITIFITIVAALIMIYVAIGVVLTIIIVLFGRVFQLWGMLIFSPLPYVAKILPAFGQVGVGGGWWSKFSKLLVSGPILAFYLWLAFTAVELYTGGLQNAFGNRPDTKVPVDRLGGDVGTTGPIVGLAKAGEVEHIMAFMIMIGILMLALQQANQFGIATAGFAAKVRAKGHKWTMRGLKGGGKFLGEHTPAGFGLGRLATKLGFEKTGKVLSAGILPGVRAAKDLAKEKFQILDKEKREQKRKLRTQAAKDALFNAYADVVEHKPSTEHAFRATTLLGQASGESEKLEKEGLLQGQGQAQHQLDLAIRRGQEARAIGIAMHMAEKGWGTPDDMMKRIKERFKTDKRSAELIEYQMEAKASKAENANKYAAPAISAVRMDLDNGEITTADTAQRIGDSKELIERASFDEVDQGFAQDRRTFNLKNIANNKGEIEVRVGVLGEWAKKVVSSAGDLDNDPRVRSRWMQRWGSEERRKQVANQLRTLVGLAERNGVQIDPAYKAAIEGTARLMDQTKDKYSQEDAAHPGRRKYNFEKIATSATATAPVRVDYGNIGNFNNMDMGVNQGAAVFNQDISTGGKSVNDQGLLGPTGMTEETKKETDKFLTGVLAQEEKIMRTADDRPTTNDEEIGRILRAEANTNASVKANIELQLHEMQSLQREITDGRTKSRAKLLSLARRVWDVKNAIRAVLSGKDTQLIDPSTGDVISDASVVFDRSAMNDRFRLLFQNVRSMAAQARTSGAYTPTKVEDRNTNNLAGGLITVVDRTVHLPQEEQYKDDRSKIAGNNLLDRGTGAMSAAKNTTVLNDRVRQLEHARSQILAAVNPRGPFMRRLQKKYRNDPDFQAAMNNIVIDLNSIDFSNPSDRSDATIERLLDKVSRLRNKYVK